MTVSALRTPEDRFENIPDFDYPVHYAEDLPGYEGLRASWVDAGPADADRTFLCLHGEPSWSFLYRKMMPVFLESGARVIAPDFFGFGRSDKPTEPETYSFDFHRDYILALVERLDLSNITLVVQDWGGLIGLTLPVDEGFRARLSRLIVMNTALGVGKSPSDGFMGWKNYAAATPDLPVGDLLARGTPQMTDEEKAAYDAPYPSIDYKMGTRRFPEMVPISPEMEGVELSLKAATYWSDEFTGASFMAVGDADPVLGPPVMNALRETINGCPEPLMIEGGGYFVQEWGEPIARAALHHFGDL
ncbi:alpha/beta fold hydrolase [Parasphingopyxis sp. CP4]|uniref:haloalkane dehalogenase n=1 Tax=Parasphingopyxis sp. CP4 TaxID=2724527 RepID=UPI0015A4A557|nr:haloalkane dehalogenase [Parasphingopyxis sp. CP4]QLC20805.1 alpha/beta fold hydrolase [Parasphingopyxis sp. CP4]